MTIWLMLRRQFYSVNFTMYDDTKLLSTNIMLYITARKEEMKRDFQHISPIRHGTKLRFTSKLEESNSAVYQSSVVLRAFKNN